MENESQEFQRAMAAFVGKGIVHVKKIEIDQEVVDAIGNALQAVYEPKVYPKRVSGKLLTSVTAAFQVSPVKELARIEFLKIAYNKCEKNKDGDALMEAIQRAYQGEENMTETVEGLLHLMLKQFAGSSTDTPTTVQDLKDHALQIANESAKVTIAYTAPRDDPGDEQLKTLWMSFAENGMVVGDKNLPVPQSVGMLRPSAYSVADEILQRLPLFNLSMFCPSACVVLTKDLHRVAASVVSLVREAVFMWIVHAVVYLEINPETGKKKRVEKDELAFQSYLDQVRSLSGFLQPFCESLRQEFLSLEGGFEENQKVFFQMVVKFTGNLTWLLWSSVLYLFEFPEITHQALQLSSAVAPRAVFTERELLEIQKHQDGLLDLRKPKEEDLADSEERDDRLISELYPELYPAAEESQVPLKAPKLQDDVNAFIEHMVLTTRYSPLAWPEITVSQLKDLWGYCEELCAQEEAIFPTTLCDVFGLVEGEL